MESWKNRNKERAWTLADHAISMVYPRRCPVCDSLISVQDHGICENCRMLPVYAYGNGPTCMKCGKPLRHEEYEYCGDCLSRKHLFDRGFAIFVYRSISGSIYRLKYMGRAEYADYYADVLLKRMGEMLLLLKPQALIPVPMFGMKKNIRGYNQAEVIADAIGKRLDIPVEKKLVIRVRNTRPMKELDEAGRRNNLKKAFIIGRDDVKLGSVIIVDDIYTTGSTADAISEVLRAAGVVNIYFLSVAIGQQ